MPPRTDIMLGPNYGLIEGAVVVRMVRFLFLSLLTLVAATLPAASHAGVVPQAPAPDAPAPSPDQPGAPEPSGPQSDAPQPSDQPRPPASCPALITTDVWDGGSARTMTGITHAILLVDMDGGTGPSAAPAAAPRPMRVESERVRDDLRRCWCLSLRPHAPPSA